MAKMFSNFMRNIPNNLRILINPKEGLDIMIMHYYENTSSILKLVLLLDHTTTGHLVVT